MKLVVVDFEATCWDGDEPENPLSEIIEIGAVKLDLSTCEIFSEFQCFIKPVINPILSPFCLDLTSIEQKDVARAPQFPEAYARFAKWFGSKHNNIFASWGYYDWKILSAHLEKWGIESRHGQESINLSKLYRAHMGGQKRGLDRALAERGIQFSGTPHRAIADARMTAVLTADVFGKKKQP